MYKIIKIGDAEVPMLAMASANVYYKQIFHEDVLRTLSSDRDDTTYSVEVIMRMGFVMAMFAKHKDRKAMQALNENSFIDWLDQFPNGDMMEACRDILAVYMGQSIPEAIEKNGDAG